MADFNKFDEYKLFIDDTARFSGRRQTVSNIYIAVNSLLLTAIGLLVKELGTECTWTLLVPLPLIAAGALISCLWRQLILKYQKLVGFRIDVLREMEEKMPDCERVYHLEDRLYPRDEDGKPMPSKCLSFSLREAKLPLIFLGLYLLFGSGILILLVVKIAGGCA